MYRLNIGEAGAPSLCVPEDFDEGAMVEITTVADVWRKFMDPKSGKTYDCEDFYKQHLAALQKEI